MTKRYTADAYCPKEPHTKYELNMTQHKAITEVSLQLPLQLSYHGSEVCADVFHPKEAPYQITKCELNSTLNKGVTDISLWLPWYLRYHSNKLYG